MNSLSLIPAPCTYHPPTIIQAGFEAPELQTPSERWAKEQQDKYLPAEGEVLSRKVERGGREADVERIYTEHRDWLLAVAVSVQFTRMEGAQDLVQDFFTDLIYRNVLSRFAKEDDVQEEHGERRRRAFLKACFVNFCKMRRRRESAQKRGGGIRLLELDYGRSSLESNGRTPGDELDRQFCEEIFEETVRAALREMAADYRRRGKGALYRRLKPRLQGVRCRGLKDTAVELGLPERTISNEFTTMQRRFRRLFLQKLGERFPGCKDLSEELHLIQEILRG